MPNRQRAFTLIELLIVIAIIAILALIAVPNFLEAQVRAKISRAVADMRTIAVGLESYFADYNVHPPNDGYLNIVPKEITTPIAYVTSAMLVDPFATHTEEELTLTEATSKYYTYMKIVTLPEAIFWQNLGRPCPKEAIDYRRYNLGAFERYGHWRMLSVGPDQAYLDLSFPLPLRGSDILYDPSNGTISFGNILRTEKSPEGKVAE